MNVKRFTGRTAREAMQKVKLAFGDDAVVLSNKPCAEGVEILAMAGEAVEQIEQFAAPAKAAAQQVIASAAAAAQPRQGAGRRAAPPAAERWDETRFEAQHPGPHHDTHPAPGEAQPRAAAGTERHSSVQDDVKRLAMSTLSFQDYVRERLLKRRQAAMGTAGPQRHEEPRFDGAMPAPAPMHGQTHAPMHGQMHAPMHAQAHTQPQPARPAPAQAPARNEAPAQALAARLAQRSAQRAAQTDLPAPAAHPAAAPMHAAPHAAPQAAVPAPQAAAPHAAAPQPWREPPVLREEVNLADARGPQPWPVPGNQAAAARMPAPMAANPLAAAAALADLPGRARNGTPEVGLEMMQELRNVKGLIEERFSAIAFLETLQRSRGSALLAQRLMDCGFSPGLVRKLVEALPPHLATPPAEARPGAAAAPAPGAVPDESAWAAQVLEANLHCADQGPALEDQGGVFALVGSTGVGKTTTTAKLAAVFAAKHGAANLGLITLDAYRVGAHEQLRAYGRILGVPVHTAHDRSSLEDLLDLLAGKKLVLIDTAGVAQRDQRCRELLDMLVHPRIRKLLVVNTAAQGETIEDVLVSYRASECAGVVLSKLDEAVKLAPALDAVIRHKLKVLAVANGQRVPEDWHRLSARALVHRALRAGGGAAWKLDPSEVHLQFITPPQPAGVGMAAGVQ